MSVPLPARVCEETARAGVAQWLDDPGCVALGARRAGADTDALDAYARAIVALRRPDAGDDDARERANALVAAYRRDDPRLTQLALEVERAFDERRARDASDAAKRGGARRPARPARPRGERDTDAGVVGAADAGVDAGAAAGWPDGEAPDGGPDEGGDGGPAAPTLKDRIVGTWVTTRDGPMRNVYALCADGRSLTTYEAVDAKFAEFLDDLPAVRGEWRAIDGEPPKIVFSSGGDSYEATITSLTADAMSVDYGEETMTLARRSTSASCD
jgi:hypothetical protein